MILVAVRTEIIAGVLSEASVAVCTVHCTYPTCQPRAFVLISTWFDYPPHERRWLTWNAGMHYIWRQILHARQFGPTEYITQHQRNQSTCAHFLELWTTNPRRHTDTQTTAYCYQKHWPPNSIANCHSMRASNLWYDMAGMGILSMCSERLNTRWGNKVNSKHPSVRIDWFK